MVVCIAFLNLKIKENLKMCVQNTMLSKTHQHAIFVLNMYMEHADRVRVQVSGT